MTQTATAISHPSKAREILDAAIQRNLVNTEAVLNQVESMHITDYIAKGSACTFTLAGADVLNEILQQQDEKPARGLEIGFTGSTFGIHDNALSQIADKTGVPIRFARELIQKGRWGAELLAQNFETIFSHGNGTQYLVRTVGNEARGFLSNKYKRLDSRPIVDAFVGECQRYGAVPMNGYALDTQIAIQVIRPEIYEPIAGDPIAIGMQFKTSDFGCGALSISPFFQRVTCLNGAIGQSLLKQVHVGGGINDIAYSQRTVDLETEATASKIKDLAAYTFEDEHVNAVMESIKQAAETAVTPKAAMELLKSKLVKSEIEAAVEAFNSPDVVALPAGQTKYRLSNAVSWISQAAEITPARRLELDRFAGELIGAMVVRKPLEV